MLKQLVGAVVLVLALAGPLAVETQSTSLAQVNSELRAALSPLYVRPGATVTVTSIDRCDPGVTAVSWSEGPGSPGGVVPTGPNGNWTFNIQASTKVGVTPVFITCVMNPPADSYKQLSFTVVAPTPPTYPG